ADRADSLTVRCDRTYYVSNSLRGGDAETVLVYARASDTTLVCVWVCDGRDTPGIRRRPPAQVPVHALLRACAVPPARRIDAAGRRQVRRPPSVPPLWVCSGAEAARAPTTRW